MRKKDKKYPPKRVLGQDKLAFSALCTGKSEFSQVKGRSHTCERNRKTGRWIRHFELVWICNTPAFLKGVDVRPYDHIRQVVFIGIHEGEPLFRCIGVPRLSNQYAGGRQRQFPILFSAGLKRIRFLIKKRERERKRSWWAVLLVWRILYRRTFPVVERTVLSRLSLLLSGRRWYP